MVGTFVNKNTKPFAILNNFISKTKNFESNFLLIRKVQSIKVKW